MNCTYTSYKFTKIATG